MWSQNFTVRTSQGDSFERLTESIVPRHWVNPESTFPRTCIWPTIVLNWKGDMITQKRDLITEKVLYDIYDYSQKRFDKMIDHSEKGFDQIWLLTEKLWYDKIIHGKDVIKWKNMLTHRKDVRANLYDPFLLWPRKVWPVVEIFWHMDRDSSVLSSCLRADSSWLTVYSYVINLPEGCVGEDKAVAEFDN